MKRAVVTGACGGIGASTVAVFLREGWHVVAIDREDPPPDLGANEFLRLDITQPSAPETITAALGGDPLHALVNNAATSVDRPMASTDASAFDRVIAANLRAPFQLINAMRTRLGDGRGAVVNVASVHALATSVNVAAYAASKGGLLSLTRAAALELAEHGIRCNAVIPGAVDTEMLRAGLGRRPHPEGPEGNRRYLESRTPLGRVGRPDEIAEAVLFLSDASRSSFITGQTLVVDGGVLAKLASE